MPNVEILDARIGSALNKIIHNSQFIMENQSGGTKKPRKRTVSFAVDRLPTWSTITSGSLGGMFLSKTTPTNSLLFFEMTIFRNSILSGKEFYCLLTQIPHDDILEGLYKLRKRESENLKSVLELYDLETHQKKLGPDDHRLQTMVKRSIEQEIRNKNFGKLNWKILRRTPWSRIRGQNSVYKEFLESVGKVKPTGNGVKGNNCSFRHDMNKRGKSSPSNPSPNSFMRQNERKPSRTRSPRGKSLSCRMSRWPCKDYLRGTCNNSFCGKWHPPEWLVLQDQEWLSVWGEVRVSHIVRLMNSRRNGLNRIMTKAQWLCWKREIGKGENLSPMDVTIERGNLWKEAIRNWDKILLNVDFLMHGNWVAYFRTWRRRSLFSGRALDMPKPIQRVKFTKAIARHTKIRDQNPSPRLHLSRWTSWA